MIYVQNSTSLSLSLSLTHTHTHFLSLSLSLSSFYPLFSFPAFFSTIPIPPPLSLSLSPFYPMSYFPFPSFFFLPLLHSFSLTLSLSLSLFISLFLFLSLSHFHFVSLFFLFPSSCLKFRQTKLLIIRASIMNLKCFIFHVWAVMTHACTGL